MQKTINEAQQVLAQSERRHGGNSAVSALMKAAQAAKLTDVYVPILAINCVCFW